MKSLRIVVIAVVRASDANRTEAKTRGHQVLAPGPLCSHALMTFGQRAGGVSIAAIDLFTEFVVIDAGHAGTVGRVSPAGLSWPR